MYLTGIYFLLAVASVLTIAAAMRGSNTSLYFLIPAGAIFLLLSAGFYQSGIQIKDGSEITIYNETKEGSDILRTENKTIGYTTLFDEDSKLDNWFYFLTAMIGLMLILVGSTWRFL